MAVECALLVEYMVMGQYRLHLEAAGGAGLWGGDGGCRSGGVGGKPNLFAAVVTGVPVIGAIGGPILPGGVVGYADHAAGGAVGVAGIIKNMGCGTVLYVAVAAGMPVPGLIHGPVFGKAVDMGTLGLQDPVADGADLVRSFRSFGAGDVGSLLDLVAAACTAAAMPVFVMRPATAVLVVFCQHLAAISTGALMLRCIHEDAFVIGVLRNGDRFHFCKGAAGTGALAFACLLAGGSFNDSTAVPGVVCGFLFGADGAGAAVLGVAGLSPGAVLVVAADGDGIVLGGRAGCTGQPLCAGVLAGGSLDHRTAVPGVTGSHLHTADGTGAFVAAVIHLGCAAVGMLAGYGDVSAAETAGYTAQAGGAGDAVAAEGCGCLYPHVDGEYGARYHRIGLQDKDTAVAGYGNLR